MTSDFDHEILIIDESNCDQRIDKLVADTFDLLSRTLVQRLIDEGLITCKGKRVKAGYRTCIGDTFDILIPAPEVPDILPEDIPLDIVYEDDDVIVINKPKGMVVHPACGNPDGTLVNALLYHCRGNLSSINGIMRPGIVHRIDKNTTGLLVACKNDNSHRSISEQLAVHSIKRSYEAIVKGHFTQMNGLIDMPIGRSPKDRKLMAVNYEHGKEARTHYKVLSSLDNNLSHIECVLETGRTHQIRVHMSALSHPLLGDSVYGGPLEKELSLSGQTLHAKTLGFIHPTTKEEMFFEAKRPQYFEDLLTKFQGGKQ